MKAVALQIMFLAMVSPLLCMGQSVRQQSLGFYVKLAKRDADYEQHLKLPNPADFEDFWRDQANFEKELSNQNPEGYRTYLKSKAESYQLHALTCAADCNHQDLFWVKSNFYRNHGDVDRIFVAVEKIKDARVKN